MYKLKLISKVNTIGNTKGLIIDHDNKTIHYGVNIVGWDYNVNKLNVNQLENIKNYYLNNGYKEIK